jgi:FdhE protein
VTQPEYFRRALDLKGAAERSPDLAAIVRNHGPAKLAEEATRLKDLPHDQVVEILQRWINQPGAPANGQTFFARVLLEPQAECLARAIESPRPSVAGNKCPVCQSDPQMAVLRPEGDGGKRLLLCSLCHTEWDFRRVLCPSCGETNYEKLPRYSAEGIAAVRVEACDTCKTYLKSVDLTIEGRAVPEVDEVATAPLDLWAAERDYHKILPNVMGF